MTSKNLELNCISPWTVVLKVWNSEHHHQQDQDSLGMQILGLLPRYNGSESLRMGPVFCVLTKLPGDSDAPTSLRAIGLGNRTIENDGNIQRSEAGKVKAFSFLSTVFTLGLFSSMPFFSNGSRATTSLL